MKVKINQIVPNPEQPRTYFDPVQIENLGQTIKEGGQIEPLWVVPIGDVPDRITEGLNGSEVEYLIIDGERRWKAMSQLGFDEIEIWSMDCGYTEAYHRSVIKHKTTSFHNDKEKAIGILNSLANRFKDEPDFEQFIDDGKPDHCKNCDSFPVNEGKWRWECIDGQDVWECEACGHFHTIKPEVERLRQAVVRCAKHISNVEFRNDKPHYRDPFGSQFKQWCNRAGYSINAIASHIPAQANIDTDILPYMSRPEGQQSMPTRIAEDVSKIKEPEIRQDAAKKWERGSLTSSESGKLATFINDPDVPQDLKEKVVKEDYPIDQAKIDHRIRIQGLEHVKTPKPDISEVTRKFAESLERLTVALDKLIENWEFVEIEEQRRFITALSRLYTKIKSKGEETWKMKQTKQIE